MSADYWNLLATFTCPACGVRSRWRLSTHFMGDTGSCLNTYKRGELIPELLGVSVLLDGQIDDFRGECPRCDRVYELGARITKGRVTKLWVLREIAMLATIGGSAKE